MDIDIAFKAELAELKNDIIDNPECGEDLGEQAFGVFRLWMRMAGYLSDDENDTIAAMREYACGVSRFGSAMYKKACGQ